MEKVINRKKQFKTEEGIKKHILKNYRDDIDFLIVEYGQDRACVEWDYFQRMVEGEDLGHETVYNLTPNRSWESYSEWFDGIVTSIRES